MHGWDVRHAEIYAVTTVMELGLEPNKETVLEQMIFAMRREDAEGWQPLDGR